MTKTKQNDLATPFILELMMVIGVVMLSETCLTPAKIGAILKPSDIQLVTKWQVLCYLFAGMMIVPLGNSIVEISKRWNELKATERKYKRISKPRNSKKRD